METSTGFYMIGTSVMKELNALIMISTYCKVIYYNIFLLMDQGVV